MIDSDRTVDEQQPQSLLRLSLSLSLDTVVSALILSS